MPCWWKFRRIARSNETHNQAFCIAFPLAKADGEMDEEGEEQGNPDEEEEMSRFGETCLTWLKYRMARVTGSTKQEALYSKIREYSARLGMACFCFRNEETFKNIHAKPLQVIDLEDTSFEPTEGDFLENDFPYLDPV